MEARKQRLIRAGLIASLVAVLLGLGLGSSTIKVRVTVDSASVKATPSASAVRT